MKIRKIRRKELYNYLDFTSNEEMDPLDSVTQFISYIDKINIKPWSEMKPKHEEYSKILNKFRNVFSSSTIVRKIIENSNIKRYLRPTSDKNSFKYTYIAVSYVIETIRYKLMNIKNENIMKEYHMPKFIFQKKAKYLINLYDNMIQKRNEIAENYFRYVVSIANNFSRNPHSSMRFSDMIQEGHIGLLKVIDSYDVKSNVRFTSYCIHGIVSQIKTALTGKSWMIRLPSWVIIGGYMISQETRKIHKKFNIYPTDDVLAELVNISKEKVAEIKEIINTMTSVASLDKLHSYEKATYDNTFDDFSDIELVSDKNNIGENYDISYNSTNVLDAKVAYEKLLDILFNKLGISSDMRRKYLLYRLGLYDGTVYSDDKISGIFGIDSNLIDDIKYNIKRDIKIAHNK